MAQNTIGTIFKVTTFGESHGAGLGCIVDGVPAGVKIDEARLLWTDESPGKVLAARTMLLSQPERKTTRLRF